MTPGPEGLGRIEELFQAASRLPPGERDALLEQACAGNEALRLEVLSLLEAQARAGAFLESPALSAAAERYGGAPALSLIGRTVGRYRIVSAVGAGGMGEVYRAEDPRLGRAVAIKILPSHLAGEPASLARFRREAKAVAALSHPNILALHDFDSDGGLHFAVMELLEGESVARRLSRGPFEWREAVEAAIAVADGLSAAHKKGIVHRDIKPDNLFLTREGLVKILDFGIARVFAEGHADTQTQATQPGLAVGTVGYMAPEQLRGEAVGPAADVFSLGCVLYEMVTGKRLFARAVAADTLAAILTADPPPMSDAVPGIPPSLEQAARRCLHKSPAERFQSASELGSALRAVLDSGGGSSRRRAAPRLRLRPGIWIAAALAVAAAAGVAVYRLQQEAGRAPRFQHMAISRLTGSGNAVTAAISPDGRYLAYVASEAGQQSFRIRQLAGNSEIQVTPAFQANYSYGGLTFSPDGNSVYYIYRRILFAIPALGGPPARIVPGIDAPAAVSPDGKRVAFYRYYPQQSRHAILVANADGGGERTIATLNWPRLFRAVSWSPDGTTIACDIGESGKANDKLALIPAGGGPPKDFAHKEWDVIRGVKWLPDGRGLIVQATEGAFEPMQLWFVSYPTGKAERITNDLNDYNGLSVTRDATAIATTLRERTCNVAVVDSRGESEPVPLTSGGAGLDGLVGLAWARDGRILYGSLAGLDRDVWAVSARGGAAVPFRSNRFGGTLPRVSRDGRYILFTGDPVANAPPHIWRTDPAGNGLLQLTHGEWGEKGADCCLDGKWVVHDAMGRNNNHLWRVPVDGGESEPWIEMNAHFPVVSPDSTMVAFNYIGARDAPGAGVAVLSAHGSSLKRFDIRNYDTTDPLLDFRPMGWTADSKGLIVLRELGGVSNLWVHPLDGGQPRQITHFREGHIFNFALSPDGKQFALARGRLSSDVVLIRDVP